MRAALFERRDLPVLAILAALAAYHIRLLGSGALAWPDEHLYNYALAAAAAIARLDSHGLGAAVGSWGARPCEVLFRSVPAAIQLALEARWGLSPYSPDSLRIAAAPNVVTSFLLSLVFYRVSLRLFDSTALAAAATIVFSLLASMNVWVRHVLPYDLSLLLCLLSLLLALGLPEAVPNDRVAIPRRLWLAGSCVVATVALYPVAFSVSRAAALPVAVLAFACCVVAVVCALRTLPGIGLGTAVAAGAAGGLGLAAYPAYYVFPLGVATLILLGGDASRPFSCHRARLCCAVLYGLTLVAVAFGFESMTRLGDTSYLGGARLLSQTIALGGYEESFVFLPKLLVTTEGVVGSLLLAAAATFPLVYFLSSPKTLPGVAVARLCSIFLVLYLVYATQAFFLHKMSFTGRYVRQYLPFVVWATAGTFSLIGRRWRPLGWCALALASAHSFLAFARSYDRVAYPADVLYRLGIGLEDIVPENQVHETEMIPGYNLPEKTIASAAYRSHPGDRRFVLVNFGTFALDGRRMFDYAPPAGSDLLFAGQHFLCFPSAVFEGYQTSRRRDLLSSTYTLRVYSLVADALR